MPLRKVMLIHPAPISQMPSGIGYLAAILEMRGIEVSILVNSFRAHMSNEVIAERVERERPDIVGLSFVTWNLLEIYDLIGRLKALGVTVVCGGVHPTVRPRECLDAGADIIVRNEGEHTLGELIDVLAGTEDRTLAEVPGLAYMQDGVYQETPARPRINALDELPFPARHLFDIDQFRVPGGGPKGFERLFAGRGCPARCTFCDRSVFGFKFRIRSPEHLVDEIEQVQRDYGITNFNFGDDTLTVKRDFMAGFCEELRRRDIQITWNAATRMDRVDQDLLHLMKKAGCFQVTYGPESGDPETLERVNKGINLDHIYRSVEMSAEADLRVYLNFMTGFPWETPKHVDRTLKVMKDLAEDTYLFQVYGAVVPYPNTPMYDDYHEEYGFTDWWLRPEHQNVGMVIYQNVPDPYRYSVYYQRNLFDDTYIYNETFFRYTSEFKKKVKELAFFVGRHTLAAQYRSRARQRAMYVLGRLSRVLYEMNPTLEMALASALNPGNRVHDYRQLGYFRPR